MLNIFIGYDHRQPVSYTVLQHSIFTHSSKPVSITPLVLNQLPIKRQGLTPFTYSRFLVPYLCGYKGWALFLDIDMLVRGDITELFDYRQDKYAVMVCKNHERFEWASLMLFNCERCQILTPQYIDDEKNNGLHVIQWVNPEEIGSLPLEWNHLVGYSNPRADAKLVHYTQGIPAHPEISGCERGREYSENWFKTNVETISTASWNDLMGNSVHAATLPDGRRVPRLSLIEEPKLSIVK